ncbi:MAG: HigA family addiction module antitoxin [Chloroflexota bacterium]|nr:HigA family addiction module antitoxin [Chloroflexota bacterium]
MTTLHTGGVLSAPVISADGLCNMVAGMPMHNPSHPGGIIERQCLERLGLSVEEAADGLGVNRQELSDVVNEKFGISVDMGIRLSKAFGSSSET